MKKQKVNKTNDTRDKKSFVEFIISHKEFITIILGLCATLYPILNAVYKKVYRSDCEAFYGLPGKYFDSNIDNRILYLACIIILISICIVPLLMKKYDKKRESITKGYLVQAVFLSIIIGMEIGVFNVYNLIEIMRQTNTKYGLFRVINCLLDDHARFTVTVVVVLGSLSVFGITIVDELRGIKWKCIKEVLFGLLSTSLVLSVLLMIYGTIFRLSISVEDKTKYEFVTYDDDEYVVLSTYDNKLLIVPFEIKKNGQYIFKTNQYVFKEPYDAIYRYIDIGNIPKVQFSEE